MIERLDTVAVDEEREVGEEGDRELIEREDRCGLTLCGLIPLTQPNLLNLRPNAKEADHDKKSVDCPSNVVKHAEF